VKPLESVRTGAHRAAQAYGRRAGSGQQQRWARRPPRQEAEAVGQPARTEVKQRQMTLSGRPTLSVKGNARPCLPVHGLIRRKALRP
jgi:hypothetical protein